MKPVLVTIKAASVEIQVPLYSSVLDFSKISGLPYSCVSRLCKSKDENRLPGSKIGGRYYIRTVEALKMLEEISKEKQDDYLQIKSEDDFLNALKAI